jgi:hypothetical protein
MRQYARSMDKRSFLSSFYIFQPLLENPVFISQFHLHYQLPHFSISTVHQPPNTPLRGIILHNCQRQAPKYIFNFQFDLFSERQMVYMKTHMINMLVCDQPWLCYKG